MKSLIELAMGGILLLAPAIAYCQGYPGMIHDHDACELYPDGGSK